MGACVCGCVHACVCVCVCICASVHVHVPLPNSVDFFYTFFCQKQTACFDWLLHYLRNNKGDVKMAICSLNFQ